MTTKAQTPALGILKQADYGDSIWYQVPCECQCPEHAHLVEVCVDTSGVEVHIYTQSTTPFWSISRWRQIWRILTKGHIEMEAVAILNEKQAINYANALISASREVKSVKQKAHIAAHEYD